MLIAMAHAGPTEFDEATLEITRRIFLGGSLIWSLSGPSVARGTVARADRPFTVRDSVQLPRLNNFVEYEAARNVVGLSAVWSPDRSRFLCLVARGDLSSGRVRERLLLFSQGRSRGDGSDSHWAFVDLVQHDAATEMEAIRDVHWIDERTVGFIAGDGRGLAQAFSVTLDGATRQLTNASSHVVSFACASGRIFYFSLVPRNEDVIVVGDSSTADLLNPDDIDTSLVTELNEVVIGETARAIVGTRARRLRGFHLIRVAPDGRRAIIIMPALSPPRWWAAMESPTGGYYGFETLGEARDPQSRQLEIIIQFALVEPSNNRVTPVGEGPIATNAPGALPIEAAWTDGERVLLSNVLHGASPETRRNAAPALVEIDAVSRTTRHLWTSTDNVRRDLWRLEGQDLWLGSSRAPNSFLRVSIAPSDGSMRDSAREAHWIDPVARRESMSEPARLYFSDAPGRSTLIFDPAPELITYQLAAVTRLGWDVDGIRWTGGLLLPNGFRPGAPVPLVIQTHGFDSTEFLIDGPVGCATAFAAQALASSGMAVLQIEDNREARRDRGQEAERYALAYRAAADQLIGEGIAARDKLGLVAFSRTGLHAFELLRLFPDLLKAVVLADAMSRGYVDQVIFQNGRPPDLARAIQSTLGWSSDPFEAARQVGGSVLQSLGRVRSAIMIQAMNPGLMTAYMEHYAMLRHARTPVEFLYFPNARHQVWKPRERLASQGATADWMNFWLRNVVDPDPGKAAQFARWQIQRERARIDS